MKKQQKQNKIVGRDYNNHKVWACYNVILRKQCFVLIHICVVWLLAMDLFAITEMGHISCGSWCIWPPVHSITFYYCYILIRLYDSCHVPIMLPYLVLIILVNNDKLMRAPISITVRPTTVFECSSKQSNSRKNKSKTSFAVDNFANIV